MARFILPRVSLCLAGPLSGAAILPRAAARVVGAAMPPIPVVPVVAAVGGMVVVFPALGAVAVVPRLRGGRVVLGCGAGRRVRPGGRLVRTGIVATR